MTIRILIGDCRTVLPTLPDQSVHCVVTSPPYFGLRDYGACGCGSGRFDLGQGEGTGGNLNYRPKQGFLAECPNCNGTGRIIGTDSQIGLEPAPQAYVEQMVAVFRDVRRVLRDDGTVWLNLGDLYGRGTRVEWSGDSLRDKNGLQSKITQSKNYGTGAVLPNKQLIGIPWRVAFALQADGWYLRQDIIWSKPNPMPESVTDRCTKAHEYIFLLSKKARYYYDAEAIAEPATPGNHVTSEKSFGTQAAGALVKPSGNQIPGASFSWGSTRNKRSVWEIATQPFSEAHFATFPPALIEPCVLAGCPKDGTVLDPFGGAGTTGMVADRLGRNAVMIELNPVYAQLAEYRIKDDAGMFADII